ncbi:peptidase domain-containing ABC transporter [Pararhodospirillum photometricum]|uniref:ABC-type protease/lipase transport system,ATPase and permease components n=1 Tax=Pararhodospirillum photometricum DSM 122 TaxID=1150469 RepID=H6SNZ2_PARPM|nr:peptidase domain-containing ABC transporter [Pararhodospirillum photometricum]CCG07064.1 ABC-type protease/lipase transport system,ATPase and permease components [Pararhodospirillum photometricum DSM 122]
MEAQKPFVAPPSGKPSWLRDLLAPLFPSFREVLALSLFVNIAALATPVFSLQIYDRVVYHNGLSTLQGLAIGMAVLLVFDFIMRQARARILQTVALRLEAQVGQRLFDKMTALPLRVLESRPAEEWLRLFRDVDVVRNTLSGASALLVCDLPFTVLFLGTVFLLAPPVGWVVVVALVLFVGLALMSGRAIDQAALRERETLGGRDGLLAEIVRGRATVKALALETTLADVYRQHLAAQVQGSVRRGGLVDHFTNLGMVLSMTTTVAMTTVGALAILDHSLTVGGLIAANMLGGRLMSPLNQLMGTWRGFAGFRQSAQRLGQVLALPEDRRVSALRLPPPSGRLTVVKASFHYTPDGPPCLEEISLDLQPGGITALVGPNGSGKTTLLKLLVGLYPPASGRVLLDGADLAQFTRAELAGWIGTLPQDITLFDGTVREAIAMGHPGLDDEAVREAAQTAGVHEMILDLPQGYATRVGEGGGLLSGGMRQRLALARALAGKPPVLLLDEPSSSLDRAAEEALVETLARLATQRSVIVVTHSPLLLARCQRVVVLNKGRVLAHGPAGEILPRLFPARRPVVPPAGAAPPAGVAS